MPKDGSDTKVDVVTVDGHGLPMWLCLELTYRCPLECPWCNNPLDFDSYQNELTTEEWKRVLAEGRKLGSLQLGFTGGEPMMRKDIVELTAEASRLGYYTNLITSGIGLTEKRLLALKEAGLNQIQLSIQSCDREQNDELVGVPSFDKKIEVARRIKREGFPMVLNIPVLRQNINQVEDYLLMAEELRVDYLEFANIQYYNWALLNRDEMLPTFDQLKSAEAAVGAARERLGDSMTIYFVVPDYFDKRPKACMNGWGSIHLTIAPDGTALPCQEARTITTMEYPSVRDHDLAYIWHDSPAFNKFRGDSWMKEPCRSCDEKEKDYGGCRCQAFLLTGDPANTDPACEKSPHHHLIETAISDAFRPGRNTRPLRMRRPGEAAAPSANA